MACRKSNESRITDNYLGHLLLVLFVACVAVGCATTAEIEEKYEQLRTIQYTAVTEYAAAAQNAAATESLDHPSGQIVAAYQRLGFSRYFDRIEDLGDEELSSLFDVALLVTLWAPGDGYVEYAERAVEELARRVQVEPRQFHRVYKAWLAERDLERAADFAARHLSPKPSPRVTINATAPFDMENTAALLRADETIPNSFIAEPATVVEQGFVVVSNPFACSFSRAAMTELAEQPATRAFFDAGAMFVMSQTDGLPYDAIREWQVSSPFRLYLAYRNSAWPMIDYWNRTPGFYVFEDGKRVDVLGGWTPETKTAIRDYLLKWGYEAPDW